MVAKLTPLQAQVLLDVQMTGFAKGEWFRPMDIGAYCRSNHSVVLRALEQKKLIESKQRSGFVHPARGAKVYRLTKLGRDYRFSEGET
jgi:hypothetical protein